MKATPQPLICVEDVENSSRWYQQLLELESTHGGTEYERLESGGKLILQLHNWEQKHHHGKIGDKSDTSRGNGLLLWFEVEDIEPIENRVSQMAAEVIKEKHRNPPEENGGPNHWEIWLKDPDGYKVVIASPDGSADGLWKP